MPTPQRWIPPPSPPKPRGYWGRGGAWYEPGLPGWEDPFPAPSAFKPEWKHYQPPDFYTQGGKSGKLSSPGQEKSLVDPAIDMGSLFPAIGDYGKYQFDPSVGLEDWLNRMYIPPGLRDLLRGALPRLLRANLGRQFSGLQAGKSPEEMANVMFGGGFQQYLASLNPFDVLRQLQQESLNPAMQRAVQGSPGLAGQGLGTRRQTI